nr:MAG TPA: hypothetical protein [Caudoviricetes sp.]
MVRQEISTCWKRKDVFIKYKNKDIVSAYGDIG